MSTTTKFPKRCSVEDGRKTKPERFAIVAPYNDGLPGAAVLGSFAYRPHAEFFAAAPELYEALKRCLQALEGDWERTAEVELARAALAKVEAPRG